MGADWGDWKVAWDASCVLSLLHRDGVLVSPDAGELVLWPEKNVRDFHREVLDKHRYYLMAELLGTEPSNLLTSLRFQGFRVWSENDHILVNPASKLNEEQRRGIRQHRVALLALAGPCPMCRRHLDHLGRCWKCHTRPCLECWRPTGSAFLSLCVACGHRLGMNNG